MGFVSICLTNRARAPIRAGCLTRAADDVEGRLMAGGSAEDLAVAGVSLMRDGRLVTGRIPEGLAVAAAGATEADRLATG